MMDNKSSYNPYQIPKTYLNANSDEEIPELYNPKASALWSILCIPFGAWIHAKNWEVLGEDKLAKQNKIAFWVLIIIIFGISLIAMLTGFRIRYEVVILLAWFFSLGYKQISYIKEKYNNRYEHKSLVKPVLIGVVGGMILFFILMCILIINLSAMGLLHESILNKD